MSKNGKLMRAMSKAAKVMRTMSKAGKLIREYLFPTYPKLETMPFPDALPPPPIPPRPIQSPLGHPYPTKLYFYPVEYGSPHHPSFAFTLCSEFSTVPPAHIVNWYLCAFNLYVSPLSVALQIYKPTRDLYPAKITPQALSCSNRPLSSYATFVWKSKNKPSHHGWFSQSDLTSESVEEFFSYNRDMNPANIIPKALPLSDSAVSDYETFVSKSKTDPSYHGWFNQSDFTIESVAELFTSNIDADDRQTIETVNIYYLCLLTLAMFKESAEAPCSNWIEKPAEELKALLRKESCCKPFPSVGSDFGKRLKFYVWRLERLYDFRAILMKSFIDLVFACRDGTTTSTFFTPFNYVIKQLEYSNMSYVPRIKTNIIDALHPIRHASFIGQEVYLFDALQKHLDILGRYAPYAKILNKMPNCCHPTSFPNLLAACEFMSMSLSERDSLEQVNHSKKIHYLLMPLIDVFDMSHLKLEDMTADQVFEIESEVRAMEAEVRAMLADAKTMEVENPSKFKNDLDYCVSSMISKEFI